MTVGAAGVRLGMLFLLRIMHPPIFIPWTAIQSVTHEDAFFRPRTLVRLKGSERRFVLYGAAGERVASTFATRVAV